MPSSQPDRTNQASSAYRGCLQRDLRKGAHNSSPQSSPSLGMTETHTDDGRPTQLQPVSTAHAVETRRTRSEAFHQAAAHAAPWRQQSLADRGRARRAMLRGETSPPSGQAPSGGSCLSRGDSVHTTAPTSQNPGNHTHAPDGWALLDVSYVSLGKSNVQQS